MTPSSLPSVGLSDDDLFFLLVVLCYSIAYRTTVWLFARRGIIDEYAPRNVEREEWIRIAIIAVFAALIGSAVLYELIELLV